VDSLHKIINARDHESGYPMAQHLRDRSARPSYHRRATGQGFDHHQTKGLGPIDRKQQRDRVAKELALLPPPNLADELDTFGFEQWADLTIEIFLICDIDLGRDL